MTNALLQNDTLLTLLTRTHKDLLHTHDYSELIHNALSVQPITNSKERLIGAVITLHDRDGYTVKINTLICSLRGTAPNGSHAAIALSSKHTARIVDAAYESYHS